MVCDEGFDKEITKRLVSFIVDGNIKSNISTQLKISSGEGLHFLKQTSRGQRSWCCLYSHKSIYVSDCLPNLN